MYFFICFILSLRQPGRPNLLDPSAFRHPVAQTLALSEVGGRPIACPPNSNLFLVNQCADHLLLCNYFFEAHRLFRKKSPNQVFQAPDSGFLLPSFQGQPSTPPQYPNKKPETGRCVCISNSGFLVQNGRIRPSAKDHCSLFTFQDLFELFYSSDLAGRKIHFQVSRKFCVHEHSNELDNIFNLFHRHFLKSFGTLFLCLAVSRRLSIRHVLTHLNKPLLHPGEAQMKNS